MAALNARNNVAHSYNKEIALDIIRQTKDKFYQMFEMLKIELDENGTKAAAATAVVMLENAAFIENEPKVVELTFDRPYAFMIYDANTDEIVFIGKVVKF